MKTLHAGWFRCRIRGLWIWLTCWDACPFVFRHRVDDQDAFLVTDRHWNMSLVNGKAWYMRASYRGFATSLHREIMKRKMGVAELPPDLEVDHKDRDTLNCTRDNLRLSTHAQNTRNRNKSQRELTSKFKGVTSTRSGKWLASIRPAGKSNYLGIFSTEREAAEAYDAAAREHYGEFAAVNFEPKPLEGAAK